MRHLIQLVESEHKVVDKYQIGGSIQDLDYEGVDAVSSSPHLFVSKVVFIIVSMILMYTLDLTSYVVCNIYFIVSMNYFC